MRYGVVARGALISLAGLGMAAPGAGHAAAFYLQEQSVRGAGRAFSGEVADEGAASLWWNPAAIGGMEGTDASAGISVILPRADVTDNGSTVTRLFGATGPVGGTAVVHNPIENGYLPTFAMAHAIAPDVAVGLAVTSPFSFTTRYDDASWVRYFALESRLRTFDFQPSVAVVPVKGFSLGAAMNVEYTKATLSQGLPNLFDGEPDAGMMALNGGGLDLGFSLGAKLKQGPLTLGVSYKSSVVHHLHGTIAISGLVGFASGFDGTTGVTARFATPWQLIMGGRLVVTSRVTLDAQVVRFGWSKFNTIAITGPVSAALDQNYRNSWSYAAGVDFAATRQLTLRAGVQRDLTPTTDAVRQPGVPDTNRWNVSGGASCHVNRWLTLDGSLSYISNADGALRASFTSLSLAHTVMDGEISKAHVLVMALGASVHF